LLYALVDGRTAEMGCMGAQTIRASTCIDSLIQIIRLATAAIASGIARSLALDARVRSQVITAVDALTLGPDKFRTEAGIYLGLRSIFWSLVRAKSDDDLREAAARLWSMAVGLEDGDISEAQAALRAAQEALRNALDRGAGDQEL
jgi:Domain of unknown function (DUF4175)